MKEKLLNKIKQECKEDGEYQDDVNDSELKLLRELHNEKKIILLEGGPSLGNNLTFVQAMLYNETI